ncbi:MAG TPA: TIGR00730 family Rossman fold protein [Vicinamibacterales bacterium]|nr:TIGR00730 family Rossman fold protein [Vicinamibacterales bacterium]
MRRVCVFCGSNVGQQHAYAEAAQTMGALLARRGIGLVYGGGNVGLMGVIADAALAAGGDVIGVIPQALANREIAHTGVSALHVVDSMHTRKAMMAELSDAFVAMPGGVGTFEEFFEAVTWTQLGLQRKPCGLLNVNGFYSPLAAFIDSAVSEGFIKPVHRAAIVIDSDPARLLDTLATVRLPDVPKWIDREET